MRHFVIYAKATGQIEHFVSSSSTQPTRADFSASILSEWATAELEDPEDGSPWAISRDHRLVIVGAEIVGTVPSPNPVQIEPEPVIDWKAKWQAADTTEKKFNLIADRLGLVKP